MSNRWTVLFASLLSISLTYMIVTTVYFSRSLNQIRLSIENTRSDIREDTVRRAGEVEDITARVNNLQQLISDTESTLQRQLLDNAEYSQDSRRVLRQEIVFLNRQQRNLENRVEDFAAFTREELKNISSYAGSAILSSNMRRLSDESIALEDSAHIAQMDRAYSAFENHRYDAAETYFTQLLEQDPENAEYRLYQAASGFLSNPSDSSQYQNILEKLAQISNDELRSVEQELLFISISSQLYFEQGEWVQAADGYSRLLQLAPDNPMYLERLGLISIFLEDYEKSLGFFQRAIQEAGGEPQYVYYAGVSALEMGNMDAAIAYFRDVLRLEPEHQSALFYLTQSYRETEQFQDAEETVRKYLVLNDDYPGRRSLGEILALQGKRVLATEQFYQALEYLNINNPIHAEYACEIYAWLSDMSLEAEDYSQSIRFSREGLEINPDNALLRFHLGKAQLRNGQVFPGRRTLRTLITDTSDEQLIRSARYELNRLDEGLN